MMKNMGSISNGLTDNNGLRQGFWTVKTSFSLMEGFYINGVRDGIWRIFTDNLPTKNFKLYEDKMLIYEVAHYYTDMSFTVLDYSLYYIGNKSDTIHEEDYI